MPLKDWAKYAVPAPMRPRVKGWLGQAGVGKFKYEEELNYWRRYFVDGRWQPPGHYQRELLWLAGQNDQSFLKDKVVADFGCGPRGSLTWATQARVRIGIDVLASHYAEFDIADQNMTYVVSSESAIPLPSSYVDVLYTVNAIDHVSHFEDICGELLRIMRPGAMFIASINLNEPATFSEPQTLTEERVDRCLLSKLKVETYQLYGQNKEPLPAKFAERCRLRVVASKPDDND